MPIRRGEASPGFSPRLRLDILHAHFFQFQGALTQVPRLPPQELIHPPLAITCVPKFQSSYTKLRS